MGVIVGYLSPPVPSKLVWKIWNGEYIDLNLLLPHWLGASEPTLANALRHKTKELKEIECIEHWVVCFNTYVSVVAMRHHIVCVICWHARPSSPRLRLTLKGLHGFRTTPIFAMWRRRCNSKPGVKSVSPCPRILVRQRYVREIGGFINCSL